MKNFKKFEQRPPAHCLADFSFKHSKADSPTCRITKSERRVSIMNISANSKPKSERLEKQCKGSLRNQFLQNPRKSASLPFPFKLTRPGFPYPSFLYLVVTLDTKKNHRSSIFLETKPQSAFNAFRALLPSDLLGCDSPLQIVMAI